MPTRNARMAFHLVTSVPLRYYSRSRLLPCLFFLLSRTIVSWHVVACTSTWGTVSAMYARTYRLRGAGGPHPMGARGFSKVVNDDLIHLPLWCWRCSDCDIVWSIYIPPIQKILNFQKTASNRTKCPYRHKSLGLGLFFRVWSGTMILLARRTRVVPGEWTYRMS